ncbi:MAG: hypothetical protein R3342_12620 [Lutibacter sp.]|uniref:hypothetical protein n=1 Tax=Lutibacter sp. TaxID=1925666 RepID=UPI00299CF0DB|nr:hypothetical protein [Lutibacter sp.]MDX1830378.1 hypothetical protein [Lutibacter sp.]
MKNFLIIFSILFFCNLNYGQIAVIKDVDGFTNVRKLPKIDSEVIYKLKNSEVFSYQENETESDWITVYISKNKYQLECGEDDTFMGYIHKSRLCPIEDLTKYTGTEFSFEYKLKEFSLENKISDFDGKWLTKINGRRIYGTDGNIPKTEVVGIETSINGKSIEIPNILYEDIFECNNEFEINKNKDDYIVHQWNSDGAGGYLIVWVLGNEKLKQRLIFIP